MGCNAFNCVYLVVRINEGIGMKIVIGIFYVVGTVCGALAIRDFFGDIPDGIFAHVAWFSTSTVIYWAVEKP